MSAVGNTTETLSPNAYATYRTLDTHGADTSLTARLEAGTTSQAVASGRACWGN